MLGQSTETPYSPYKCKYLIPTRLLPISNMSRTLMDKAESPYTIQIDWWPWGNNVIQPARSHVIVEDLQSHPPFFLLLVFCSGV